MKSRKNIKIGMICIVLLIIVSGCGGSEIDNTNISYIDTEKVNHTNIDVTENNKSNSLGYSEKVYDLVKEFFNKTQEYPINADIYNIEMDKEYKEAFLEYIFNKEPMTYYVYRGDKAVSIDTFRYTFVDDIGINWYLVKKNLESAVVDLIKYWYLDYDGDGMPELIMDMGGKTNPYVYKYNPDKKCVSLYYAGDSYNWHFLNSQTLYCKCGKNLILVRNDADGNELINIKLITKDFLNNTRYWIKYYNQEDLDNIIEESVFVDEETWNELQALFYDTVAPSLTFEEVFGDFSAPYIDIDEWS